MPLVRVVSETCFCAEEAGRRCRSCRRARCDVHLTESLCNRCAQALERELAQVEGRAWIVGGVAGSVAVLGLLAAGVGAACLAGAFVGFVAAVLQRQAQRARLLEALGPRMAVTTGELERLPEPPAFPSPYESYED